MFQLFLGIIFQLLIMYWSTLNYKECAWVLDQTLDEMKINHDFWNSKNSNSGVKNKRISNCLNTRNTCLGHLITCIFSLIFLLNNALKFKQKYSKILNLKGNEAL